MTKPRYDTISGPIGIGILRALETHSYETVAAYLFFAFNFYRTRQHDEYWGALYIKLYAIIKIGEELHHDRYLEVREHIIEMMEGLK